VNFKKTAEALFYPMTEWLNYAVLGFLAGLAWATLGPIAALGVLVLSTFTLRPVDTFRWRLAKTLGLDVAVPTPIQMVFSQTIGVVILIGVAGLWGVQVPPMEVLGIAVVMLVASSGLAYLAQRRGKEDPR
jgi:hypothetical protein